MYAVIFTAELNELDETYSETAMQMRELAITKYGCTKFNTVTEASREIAISYWQSQEQIRRWKRDARHLAAQGLGREKWYKAYQVEVVEIIREYSHT